MPNMQGEKLEKEIERDVCSYARTKGWMAYKFNSESRRSVPDRIMISPKGQVVFVEFKMKGKKPTELQAREHEKLKALKQIVMVIDNVADGLKLVDSLE